MRQRRRRHTGLPRVPAAGHDPGGKHNSACIRAAAALVLIVSCTRKLDAALATTHLWDSLALQRAVWGEAEGEEEEAFWVAEEVDGGGMAMPATMCRQVW